MNRTTGPLRLLAAALVLLPAALGSCGCNRQDADRLAQLGVKLGQKAETLAGGQGRALSGWQVSFPATTPAIDARVAQRLTWDKQLAEAEFRVQVRSGIAELQGKVKSLDQRRRALELAQTTLGVEKVVDRLEGP